MSSKAREIDPVTGVETTGHEWDGIKELNKPLPKWWLWTFYATIVWAIGYWIAYPAWPTMSAYTKGVFGYSQRDVVAKDIAAAQSQQTLYRDKIKGTPLAFIRRDPDLYRFAISAGSAAFQNNCAPCHGRGAQGFIGYPNLNDDDWLWGGSLEDIERTIRFGIRSDSNETRSAQMPRFGLDQLLSDKEIADVVEYVLSLSGKSEAREAIARGAKTFAEQCSSCHGDAGKGKAELGAPDLTDAIWLYGDSRQAVSESVRTGRGAVMPAWAGRLDAATLKALALYVHGLGGGK
jgi:cytochrome c oxidase cbb3-type subunit 3